MTSNNDSQSYKAALTAPRDARVATKSVVKNQCENIGSNCADTSKKDDALKFTKATTSFDGTDDVMEETLSLTDDVFEFCKTIDDWFFSFLKITKNITNAEECDNGGSIRKLSCSLYGTNVVLILKRGLEMMTEYIDSAHRKQRSAEKENSRAGFGVDDGSLDLLSPNGRSACDNFQNLFVSVNGDFKKLVTMLKNLVTHYERFTTIIDKNKDSLDYVFAMPTAHSTLSAMETTIKKYADCFSEISAIESSYSFEKIIEIVNNVASKCHIDLDSKMIAEPVVVENDKKRRSRKKKQPKIIEKEIVDSDIIENAVSSSEKKVVATNDELAEKREESTNDVVDPIASRKSVPVKTMFIMRSEFPTGKTYHKSWIFKFNVGQYVGVQPWNCKHLLAYISDESYQDYVDHEDAKASLYDIKVYASLMRRFGWTEISAVKFLTKTDENKSEIVMLNLPAFFWIQFFMCLNVHGHKNAGSHQKFLLSFSFGDLICNDCKMNHRVQKFRKFFDAIYQCRKLDHRVYHFSFTEDLMNTSNHLLEYVKEDENSRNLYDFDIILDKNNVGTITNTDDMLKMCEIFGNAPPMPQEYEKKWMAFVRSFSAHDECAKKSKQ